MNSITELLNLEDADIFISDISINGTKKILTLETKPVRHSACSVVLRCIHVASKFGQSIIQCFRTATN